MQLKNVKLIYNDKQKPSIKTLERLKVARTDRIYNCKRKFVHLDSWTENLVASLQNDQQMRQGTSRFY
jgi:hypothetical protein